MAPSARRAGSTGFSMPSALEPIWPAICQPRGSPAPRALQNPLEVVLREGQSGFHLIDGELREGSQESRATRAGLVPASCQCESGSKEAVRPASLGMLGDAARKPTCGLVIPGVVEQRSGEPEVIEKRQRIAWREIERKLEAFESLRGLSPIAADPATAAPCPGKAGSRRNANSTNASAVARSCRNV